MNEDRQTLRVAGALAKLTDGSPFNRDLVTQLADMVNTGSAWPEGEPDNTVRILLQAMFVAPDDEAALWRIPHATFQVLFLEFTVQWQEQRSEVARNSLEKIISLAVEELKHELERVQAGKQRNDSATRLALIIALAFSAVPSAQLAQEFVETIRALFLTDKHCMPPDQENLLYGVVKGHDMFGRK